jgi:hypothetical protein
VAEQTPALLGAVSTSKRPPPGGSGGTTAHRTYSREKKTSCPNQRHHTTAPPAPCHPPSANGSASWIGTVPIPPGRILNAPSAILAGPPASVMHHATANCVRGFPGSGHEP